MSHAELKHSDFLLHADPGRLEVYKKNQKLWWSKQLNKWMCMNPELIQFILNSENKFLRFNQGIKNFILDPLIARKRFITSTAFLAYIKDC